MPESKSPPLIKSEISPHIAAYWHLLCQQIHAKSQAQGVYLSRCVVLVPFAQLLPVARRYWAEVFPDGFVPQFQTTKLWAMQFGGFQLAPHDISFEAARDVLTAAQLLEQSGIVGKRWQSDKTAKADNADKSQKDLLASRLLEAVYQISAGFAALNPNERLGMAEQLRAQQYSSGADSTAQDWLRLENGLAHIAIAWAATSRYATDVLFDTKLDKAKADLLLVMPGFQRDALAQKLVELWRLVSTDSAQLLPSKVNHIAGQIKLYKAQNMLDEAESAAACVMRHLIDGRTPVALVANDRALTRRVHAMLRAENIDIKDENGWKLSTTRAAATLMSSLSACSARTSSDQVLDWLKNSGFLEQTDILLLERSLRQARVARWLDWVRLIADDIEHRNHASTMKVESLRHTLTGMRKLSEWLLVFRQLLQNSQQWDDLCADHAGEKILAVLHLTEDAEQDLESLAQAQNRMSLAEFEKWVNLALESSTFIPDDPSDAGEPQVVILPLSQLLGRPFAAVVIPGCDEARVNASRDFNELWSKAQKSSLGLFTPEEQHAIVRQAWQNALATPVSDVLWRAFELSGESLQISNLVQSAIQNAVNSGAVPHNIASDQLFERRLTDVFPSTKPLPMGAQLTPKRLSSSGYEKLRNCPYQFFALHMLGLKEDEELVDDISKRDFGTWLHAVLNLFHQHQKNIQNQPEINDLITYTAIINIAEETITQSMKLPADAFLPWASTWPKLRDAYLEWLIQHESSGFRFEQSELACQTQLGDLTLHGRIDRIDRIDHAAETASEQTLMLIDYKTESSSKTAQRVKDPFEDTQLAFYGALLDVDTLRAAYVNVGEKETKTVEQTRIFEIRDALIEGVRDDMSRIGRGAAMPALGEGSSCDYCVARGLCRKDFWSEAQ